MGADGRVEALFHEALTRPPAERDAFLAAACDAATAREVRELLQASEDAPWFLDHPLVASLAGLGDGDLPIGTRIGDYEISERLGSGWATCTARGICGSSAITPSRCCGAAATRRPMPACWPRRAEGAALASLRSSTTSASTMAAIPSMELVQGVLAVRACRAARCRFMWAGAPLRVEDCQWRLRTRMNGV